MKKGYKHKTLTHLEATVNLTTGTVKVWSYKSENSIPQLIMEGSAQSVIGNENWYCPADMEALEIKRLEEFANEPKVYSESEVKSLIRSALTDVEVYWRNDGSGDGSINEYSYNKFIERNLKQNG